MADGDFDVKILSRKSVPGGYSLTGVAKNDKVEVVGSITGTYNTAGLVVNAADVGLSTIDAIFFSQVTLNSTAPTATAPASAIYTATSGNSGNIIAVTNETTQAEAGDSQAISLVFLAVGDSALVADLT